MTRSNVIDVNVWLALLCQSHTHHGRSLRWYGGLTAEEGGLCRVAHVSLIRLLCTQKVMGSDTLPAASAWLRVEELLEDERVLFLSEPQGFDAIWPTLLRYRQPTPSLVPDSYLAAFAMAGGHKLVTFDRGFLEFRGLEVEILGG
ncbi:MAG: TA system VapC family ribonuclease toxin [Bryobacteraceae bacterium]